MKNLLDYPDDIERGELYKVTGIKQGISYTSIAKARRCVICDIGYDFMLIDYGICIIGDSITSITIPIDENDIEYYEGSHPSA